MRTNKPLKQKTPLKAKTTLKARPQTKKQAVAEVSLLKRKADAFFGHYVRLRDAELVGNIEWQSECISCKRVKTVRWYDEDKQKWRWGKSESVGHFVTRTNWFLRFNEYNCNGQCSYCNNHLSGNSAAYHIAIDYKYGDGTANELIQLYKHNKEYRITKEELENVIKASKEYLDWCYSQEEELNA